MMLAAAILLQAAAPVFAPPLGVALAVTTEHHSTTGGKERNYALRRLVRFQRISGGYRAEVRVAAPKADAPAAIGGMIEAGFAALAGRTLVFSLDPAGKVTGIEQMDLHWERLCEGIGAMVADSKSLDPAGRAALTQRIAAPLRALPEDRRRAMLSTLVTAVIIEEPAEAAGTVAPVRLPGSSPLGAQMMLEGVRTTSAANGGELQSVTRASNVAAASGDGRVELERIRRFDPRTGIASFSSETSRMSTGSMETVRSTVVRLVPAPPTDWGGS